MPTKDSTVVRVPNGILEQVRQLIKNYNEGNKKADEELQQARLSSEEATGIKSAVRLLKSLPDGTFEIDREGTPMVLNRRLNAYTHSEDNKRIHFEGRLYRITVHYCGAQILVNAAELRDAVKARNKSAGRVRGAEGGKV